MNSIATDKGAAPPTIRETSLWNGAHVVFVLFLCFVFSYLDRQIVSILVQPLKASLAFTDTQIGMLQGLAFTLCYATGGVFVARIVDRSNRVRLVAACVTIWAISTAMCGTAHSLGELLLWRSGTAIAEAALSPAAVSIFSDMFAPGKVTRATGVFMLGPYVGGGIALLGGGYLLGWTDDPAVRSMLGSVHLQPWQLAFFTVGLPGVLLALLVLAFIKEPARRGLRKYDSVPTMKQVLHELVVRQRFAMPYFMGYVALILLFYSYSAWFPTLLMRKFDLAASVAGKSVGPVYMIGGIAGVIGASLLVGKVRDADTLRKVLTVAAGAGVLLVPVAFAAPLVSSLPVALAMYGLCAFAASIVMALAPVPVQVALENRMRGRAIALLVFLTNSISGGVGPLLVGGINDRLADGAHGLAVALASVGVSSAICSAALYAYAARCASRGCRVRE